MYIYTSHAKGQLSVSVCVGERVYELGYVPSTKGHACPRPLGTMATNPGLSSVTPVLQ